MSVTLRQSTDLSDAGRFDRYCATTGTVVSLDSPPKVAGLTSRLEAAFESIRNQWWSLGKELGRTPTAELAHMPTCSTYSSDFGVMLAWSELIRELASEDPVTLVLCNDPWLFRHLSTLEGVRAGNPPLRWTIILRLRLRGILSRTQVAFRVAQAVFKTRSNKNGHGQDAAVLLVYGHPESTSDGHDAYFGPLMNEIPELKRLLHTDCPAERAAELVGDGRTASLHAWGKVSWLLTLPFLRWRPTIDELHRPEGYLIQRAVEMEGSGGSAAMNRWQSLCQDTWLRERKPRCVVWPWENHPWERSFVRSARRLGTITIGYQHTVVGRHMFNQSTASNPDGLESIPDFIVANGPAYRAELAAWGVPEDRLVIGGAFRFPRPGRDLYDPKGPVFVPLSSNPDEARQLVAAARAVADSGRAVLVKDHPLYPLNIRESANLSRTTVPMAEHDGLSAVLYTTGTSGLDALLEGLPTFRLMLEDRIAIDILPATIKATAVTPDGVVEVLCSAARPRRVEWESVLAPPDMELWRRLLAGEGRPPERRRPGSGVGAVSR